MDVLEVSLFDGRLIYAFDGRVLEIFGDVSVASGRLDAMRIHVQQLSVQVPEPDKKGVRQIVFVGLTGYKKNVPAGEREWTQLQPLLEALHAAGAHVES